MYSSLPSSILTEAKIPVDKFIFGPGGISILFAAAQFNLQ